MIGYLFSLPDKALASPLKFRYGRKVPRGKPRINKRRHVMKTGNGAKPNPKGIFAGACKAETSNMVKASTGKAFSAKRDVIGPNHSGPVRSKK